MIGGWLGDRWIGRTRGVVAGAVLMTLGHFLLTFYETLLPALVCLLLGLGCFNANLRAQIGELYEAGDLRRAAAFQIYTMSVSLAVIVAPLICGTLGETRGFAWGFASAGIGMALGLATYLAGRRWMPPEPARDAAARAARPPLDRQDRQAILLLVLLVPVLALASVGNMQIFNAYLVWGDANYDLVFFGDRMPVSWLLSLDAFISAATIALTVLFWRWWGQRFREPDEIGKLTIGAIVSALAPLLLAVASLQAAAGHKVGLGWGIAFHIVNDIGFSNLYPIGMALFSRAAPPSLRGTMVSVFALSLFLANMIDGRLGGLLDHMSGAAFWALHAVLIAIAALSLLSFGRLFSRRLPGAELAESMA
jgi:POT family proton-dependent oligopeptide transporter